VRDRIVGPSRIRSNVWTADDHLKTYRTARPTHTVVGWVGNGNLLCNPHFVAFDGSGDRPRLFHLATEARHFGRQGRIYTCLVVRRHAGPRRVAIESLRFDYVDGSPEVYTAAGQRVTDEIEYATYGQQLVKEGRAVDDQRLIEMVQRGEFYDLRHVFLMGRIALGDDRWIDAGLSGLRDIADERLDTVAIKRALRGEVVFADVGQFSDAQVRDAMCAKGYRNVPEPEDPGDFSVHDGTLAVIFRQGIYPHNLIGIRHDGRLISVAIEGLSNRVGVTIRGAAEIMKELGAQDAIMLDNGGDVMMSVENATVTDDRVTRLRSMLLFRAQHDHIVEDTDLVLTRYPAQYADAH
jgi:hypothetical protein